mmetsp:Transcript_34281/g.49815  ORF Transcript_34281/g.49815 Transcript_34281/m.49815 type:complete len:753 (+) Transcript_34281:62-2320(+)
MENNIDFEHFIALQMKAGYTHEQAMFSYTDAIKQLQQQPYPTKSLTQTDMNKIGEGELDEEEILVSQYMMKGFTREQAMGILHQQNSQQQNNTPVQQDLSFHEYGYANEALAYNITNSQRSLADESTVFAPRQRHVRESSYNSYSMQPHLYPSDTPTVVTQPLRSMTRMPHYIPASQGSESFGQPNMNMYSTMGVNESLIQQAEVDALMNKGYTKEQALLATQRQENALGVRRRGSGSESVSNDSQPPPWANNLRSSSQSTSGSLTGVDPALYAMYAPPIHPPQQSNYPVPFYDPTMPIHVNNGALFRQQPLLLPQPARFNSADDETYYATAALSGSGSVPGMQSHSSHGGGIRRTNSAFTTVSGAPFTETVDLSSTSYARPYGNIGYDNTYSSGSFDNDMNSGLRNIDADSYTVGTGSIRPHGTSFSSESVVGYPTPSNPQVYDQMDTLEESEIAEFMSHGYTRSQALEMLRHQATVSRTRILVEGNSHSSEDDSSLRHSHSVVATEVAPTYSRSSAIIITPPTYSGLHGSYREDGCCRFKMMSCCNKHDSSGRSKMVSNRAFACCSCFILFMAIGIALIVFFMYPRAVNVEYLSTALEPSTNNVKNNPSLIQTFRITNNNYFPIATSSYNFIMEASPAPGQSKSLFTYSQSGATELASNNVASRGSAILKVTFLFSLLTADSQRRLAVYSCNYTYSTSGSYQTSSWENSKSQQLDRIPSQLPCPTPISATSVPSRKPTPRSTALPSRPSV